MKYPQPAGWGFDTVSKGLVISRDEPRQRALACFDQGGFSL